MDAGHSEKDNAAKQVDMDQLIEYVLKNSQGQALIMAGDFNLKKKWPEDKEMLERLEKSLQLTDACVAMGGCEDRIDRIYFRSSDRIKLQAAGYKVEKELFQDPLGFPLSDHLAVSAIIEWKSVDGIAVDTK
jgi:endonuclease/exonuclease/phosphatase family metal-dependent hydrolase